MRDRVRCAPGLTAWEIKRRAEYGFRFPDLRVFPSTCFRSASAPDGVLGSVFDVEHNAFWLAAWGPKPDSLEKAQAKAREAVRAAPFMIPIFGHRYLPASPCASGNPVFSVYQTDIIYYGLDLPSYLFAEFGVPNPFPIPDSPRDIEFWSELERLNG
jgi:hypothetical protein